MMKKIATEAQEQTALFRWAAMAKGRYPELELMYAVPNGGSRNPIEGRHLKEQGVRAGVPDICLPVPAMSYTALYIEMKRTKGGRLSNEQRWYLAMLQKYGAKAIVCEGWEQARLAIMEYLA